MTSFNIITGIERGLYKYLKIDHDYIEWTALMHDRKVLWDINLRRLNSFRRHKAN